MTSTTIDNITPAERAAADLLAALAHIGGDLVREDALTFEGTKVILPASMSGDINAAIRFLRDHQEQMETEHSFTRTFRYGPLDGAFAFDKVLRDLWGTTGHGRPIHTLFGDIPPTFVTIDVGVNKTAQVPQNRVHFAPLQADIYLTGVNDPDVGPLFKLQIDCPRKFRGHVEGLFTAIEAQLRTGSIYKGKAITGATIPTFIDTSLVKRESVVYSQEVLAQLEVNIWSVLRYGAKMKQIGMSRKRAVLLEGPFGTGKTLAAYLTAQEAEAAGWTFLFCRPTQDDLAETMQTALLYAPSVVFFEDVDVVAEDGDPGAVSKLLDLFDGVGAKGQDCVAVLTTNHVDRIHKAMLRPGRLDAVVHIGSLDREGFEQLIRSKISPELLGDLDMDVLEKAFDGMLPAFAAEAIDRSIRYSMARNGGEPGVIETNDLALSAEGLKPQLQLMNDAAEGKRSPTLDQALLNVVRQAHHGAVIVDRDGDSMFQLDTQREPLLQP